MIKGLLVELAEHTKEVTTLDNQERIRIEEVDEKGLYIHVQKEQSSDGGSLFIEHSIISDAWEQLRNKRTVTIDDFSKASPHSSFLLAFFNELPFVEKANDSSIKLKGFTTNQLPESTLQQSLSLLDEIINEELNPKKITFKYSEDGDKRLKYRARQGLKILGFLTEEFKKESQAIQDYQNAENKMLFLARQMKKAEYLSSIYKVIKFIKGWEKDKKLSTLIEVGQLVVRNSKGTNQMVSSVSEYRTRNILNWFKQVGLVDEEWNTTMEEKLRPLLLKVMDGFIDARRGEFAQHPLGKLLRKQIPVEIRSLDFINEKYHIVGSVGKGNWTTVPWLAIMNKGITTTTQQGYYIVYLYSEDMKRLYLTFAQGVTKTSKEEIIKINEEIRSSIKMDSRVHKDNDLNLGESSKAREYKEAVAAYISYSKENFPSEEQLIEDLEEMVEYYKQYVSLKEFSSNETDPIEPMQVKAPSLEKLNSKEVINQIDTYIASKGFYYKREEVENLYLSLKTKPFVILSGISGTGKTMIVKWLAESVGATKDNGQFTLIPVRPDWNDSSDLLGYVDIKGEFKEGPLTRILINAKENPDNPYIVLLDEMNLARVEYYFSDVLSVMESREKTNIGVLQSLPLLKKEIAGQDITFPDNVYIIGTVNMDETTYPFSKKVLDRANTIEFNDVNLEHLAFLEEQEEVEPISVHNNTFVSSYIHLKDVYNIYKDVVQWTTSELVGVNNILKGIDAHVGYRVRDEISFYLAYNKQGEVMSTEAAFDRCVLQKILPRISGSDMRVERVLTGLYKFFTGKEVPQNREMTDVDVEMSKYPKSTRKVVEMLRRLDDDGFTSFWVN